MPEAFSSTQVQYLLDESVRNTKLGASILLTEGAMQWMSPENECGLHLLDLLTGVNT